MHSIETIRAGDFVLSANAETMQKDYKPVLETYVRQVDRLVHLTVNVEEIITTVDHPFYVNGQGFVNAVDLCIGSELVDRNGNILKVKHIFRESLHDETCDVYNFKVDEWHTYFVGDRCILVHNADYANDDLKVSSEDLKAVREKYGLSDVNTVAVGKTDIPELNNITFEGGSPKVRNELGIPDLDLEMPNRSIRAPGDNPLFTRHAEEVIANKFDLAVQKAGIAPENVRGTLRIHQSNPTGVCRKCIQGLSNNNVKPGVLKQLSQKYPELIIKITSERDSCIKVSGRSELIIKNGEYID